MRSLYKLMEELCKFFFLQKISCIKVCKLRVTSEADLINAFHCPVCFEGNHRRNK